MGATCSVPGFRHGNMQRPSERKELSRVLGRKPVWVEDAAILYHWCTYV
jgi:hypothetical protein